MSEEHRLVAASLREFSVDPEAQGKATTDEQITLELMITQSGVYLNAPATRIFPGRSSWAAILFDFIGG